MRDTHLPQRPEVHERRRQGEDFSVWFLESFHDVLDDMIASLWNRLQAARAYRRLYTRAERREHRRGPGYRRSR